MGNEMILNVDDVLQPISVEAPTGSDLRLNDAPDSIYYALREARQNARAIERNTFPGENTDRLEMDHWKLIAQKAPEALKNDSKDLEIAAWLTEALLRLHGFAGLRQGVTLINGLINQYWDDLYPLPDEDGISTRVAVLAGLNGSSNNGTLIAPITTAPITKDGNYSTWSYTQALDLAKVSDPTQKKKKMDSGIVPLETIKASVKPSASEFYEELQADIQTALSEIQSVETQLNALCGAEAPQTGYIEKALNNALSALRIIAKEILNPISNDASAFTDDDVLSPHELSVGEESTEFRASGNIKDRLAALKNLQTLADFFKRSEPHSPIGFTLERIVRWGDMSLPELLQELIPDPQAKDYYQKLVGILPPAAPTAAPMMGQPGMPAQPNPYNPDPYQNNMGGNDPYGGGYGQPGAGGYDSPMYK